MKKVLYPWGLGNLCFVAICRHHILLNFDFLYQMVKSAGMKALHGLFVGDPKPTSLPADLNAQIITVSSQTKCET